MNRKFQKFLICLLPVLILIFALPATAYADIGPKPSVQIQFDDLEDNFYVTLLSQNKSTGPYSYDFTEETPPDYMIDGDDAQTAIDAWQAMRQYKDSDGFYFIGFMDKCSSSDDFNWGYYPPAVFKVLIYLPQSGEMLVSDIQQRYAFDSYFSLTTANGVTIKQSYNYLPEMISLGCRMVLTIAIEVLLAFLFKIKGKPLLLWVCGANILTQVGLNVFLNISNYQHGHMAFVVYYILGELAVLAAEMILYLWLCKKYSCSKTKMAVYAFVSNAASFAAGMWLAQMIPGIF